MLCDMPQALQNCGQNPVLLWEGIWGDGADVREHVQRALFAVVPYAALGGGSNCKAVSAT